MKCKKCGKELAIGIRSEDVDVKVTHESADEMVSGKESLDITIECLSCGAYFYGFIAFEDLIFENGDL